MKKLNKKSKLFAFGLAITLLIVLLRVFFLVTARSSELRGKEAVGSNQMNVFEAIQEAEKSILYGEGGFSLAFQQSLYDVSYGGGYTTAPGCGKFMDYNVWRKDNDTECYPKLEAVKQNIAESTLDMLNKKYLSNNPYVKATGSYKNNHELFFEQNGEKLIGRAYALSPVMDNIICNYGRPPVFDFGWVVAYYRFGSDVEGTCGRYYYRQSFRKEIRFDINDFETVADEAKRLASDIEDCKKGKSIRVCVDEGLRKHPKISRNCVGGASEVFSSFVNRYLNYLMSPKADCVAYFSPPQLIDVDKETVIRLKLISAGSKTRIAVEDLGFSYEVDAPGPYFTEYYNDPNHPSVMPSNKEIQYVLTYDKNGKLTNQELNYGEGSFFSADWDLPGNLMLYKESPNKLVFVDTDDYGEFDAVHFCIPQLENTFAFCYDTGKKAAAYDAGNKVFGIQDLKIMFALSFP